MASFIEPKKGGSIPREISCYGIVAIKTGTRMSPDALQKPMPENGTLRPQTRAESQQHHLQESFRLS